MIFSEKQLDVQAREYPYMLLTAEFLRRKMFAIIKFGLFRNVLVIVHTHTHTAIRENVNSWCLSFKIRGPLRKLQT